LRLKIESLPRLAISDVLKLSRMPTLQSLIFLVPCLNRNLAADNRELARLVIAVMQAATVAHSPRASIQKSKL